MRVVIVEDQQLFLDALATALQEGISLDGEPIEVVGRAHHADEALAVIEHHQPDVVLLDIRLPPDFTDEGLRLAELVRVRSPQVGLLVLSSYAEVAYARRLLSIEQEPHAVGYLLKERVGDLNELADAIRRVAAGDVVIDSFVVTRLMTRRRQHDPLAALTPQERRVLAMVAEGRSNHGIAEQLRCQVSTVEKHLSVITGKLGLATAGTERKNVNVRVLATLEFLRNSSGPHTPS